MPRSEWPLSPNLSCLSHLPTYKPRQQEHRNPPERPENRIIKAYQEFGYPVNRCRASTGKGGEFRRIDFRCSEYASEKTLRTTKYRCQYRGAVVQRYGDYFLQWHGKHNHDPYLEASGLPATDPSGAPVGIQYRPGRFRFVKERTPLSSREEYRDHAAARALRASSTQRKRRANISSGTSVGIRFTKERTPLSSWREYRDHSAAHTLQPSSTQRNHRADIPSRASVGTCFVEERPSHPTAMRHHDHSAACEHQPSSTQLEHRADIPSGPSIGIHFVEEGPSLPSGWEGHDSSAARSLQPSSTQHIFGVTILKNDLSMDDHLCQIMTRDEQSGYPLVVGERSDNEEGQHSSCILRCTETASITTHRPNETGCEYKAIVYTPHDGEYYLQISGEHNHPPILHQ